MLLFAGVAYTKIGDTVQFKIKATSESEAKKKLKDKYLKRKKKVIFSKIDLEYVDIV